MTPIDPAEVRLDKLRGDVLVAFGALTIHAEIAARYIEVGADDRLVTVINDTADRARELVRLRNELAQTRQDAALAAEAASEWRAQHGDRRGAA